jgi:hypothetical protein
VLPSESSFIKVHLMISDDISNPMTTPGRLWPILSCYLLYLHHIVR